MIATYVFDFEGLPHLPTTILFLYFSSPNELLWSFFAPISLALPLKEIRRLVPTTRAHLRALACCLDRTLVAEVLGA